MDHLCLTSTFQKSTLVCLSAPHLPINHDDAFTNKIDNS